MQRTDPPSARDFVIVFWHWGPMYNVLGGPGFVSMSPACMRNWRIITGLLFSVRVKTLFVRMYVVC
jgi:hypothetical protein